MSKRCMHSSHPVAPLDAPSHLPHAEAHSARRAKRGATKWQVVLFACLFAGICAPAIAQIAFVDGGSITVGNNPWFIASGNFKPNYAYCGYGNDYTDLAVANWGSNSVSLAYGYTSLFTQGWNVATPIGVDAYPVSLAVGDFNRDGLPDIAVASNSYVGVLLDDGSSCSTFSYGAAYTLPSGPHFSLATADFDGDGKLDLVVTNGGSNSISVLLGNGDGTFKPAVPYAVGRNPNAVVAADFYGLGRPDLAVVNYDDNNVSILYGIGDGTFLFVRNVAVGAGPNHAAVGDLNRDGKQDLVVTNYAGNSVSVLLGKGNGTFAPATYTATPGAAFVVIGDINYDEVPDLVVANYNNNTVTMLQGNGDGSLQDAVVYNVGAGPYSMVLGWFAGSFGLDLVVANRLGNTLSQLSNGTIDVYVNRIVAGNWQHALVNTAFGHQLSIFAEDVNGNRYDGRVTTFTLPSTGPSGTFPGGSLTAIATTAFGGVAESPPITANGIPGRFVATASVSVGRTPTTFMLTNLPADDVFVGGFE